MDLKKEISKFVIKNNIKAGVLVTCVGSLTHARLRLADESIIKDFDEKFEILSLVGTLGLDDIHLHISLGDSKGNAFGGHLLDGCTIYTTAEIVIGDIPDLAFTREFSPETSFKELEIKNRE
jgi:predicted DNA-binding protein with PD1-like motif